MMERSFLQATLQKVSQRMMCLDNQGQVEKFPVSLLDMQCWEWPQGVGLLGLVKYALAQGDEAVLAFVEDWYDRHMPAMDTVERNVNSTAPMLALTYLAQRKPKPEYLALMESWADWTMDPKGLLRTGDGCIQHMITGDPNDGQLLIDTLFMTVLFMIRAGTMLKRPEMVSEANYQILAHIKYLFDPACGLFYHGWSFRDMNRYGGVHWLRGNAWYTVGCIDFITEQEALADEVRRFFLATLERQAGALLQTCDAQTGLWHTVIDEPSSYLELSGSAGCLCGMMKAVRLGFLDEKRYLPLIRRGIVSALGYIGADGSVANVSYGTPVGMDKQFYMDIPCFVMTYGQAAMILMLEEAMNPYWAGLLDG
ncbi:MAG TPA: glycoside hydrolase family 88 protein [Candidatus Limiplasma stercoravium]|nr:glycoside hydrolase family 88 protein [Candidatus Limiplasma stercoravium]